VVPYRDISHTYQYQQHNVRCLDGEEDEEEYCTKVRLLGKGKEEKATRQTALSAIEVAHAVI
jgi:hypothetical protein